MMKGLFLFTISAFPAVAAMFDATDPTNQFEWTHYVSMLTPLILFTMGLVAKPLLENVVTNKLEFFAMEEMKAHKDILMAIEKTHADFAAHNTDAFSHPNLMAHDRMNTKMDALTMEVAALRAEFTQMRAGFSIKPLAKTGKK